MTVLVDATPLATGHRWRGIGRYVRALTSGVAQQLPDASRFLVMAGVVDGLPPWRVVQFRSVMPPIWADTWPLYTRSLKRSVAGSRCSLYHFTCPEASLTSNGIHTIATVYDLIPLESYRPSRDPRAIWRHYVYGRYLDRLRAADQLIAISRSTANSLAEHLAIPRHRITVIPLGVDRPSLLELAARPGQALASRYRLPGQYWLSTISPNPNKGWPDLLAALALARKQGSTVPLVMAGHWLPKQRRQLMAEAGALAVSDLLHFIGYVSDEDLPALYRHALGFVFPSHREGFGLPALEAMAAGTPAIVSDDPALLELTADAALHFPRGDAAALAEQMIRLARDERLRGQLGALGSARSSQFTWESTVSQTVELYRRLQATTG